MLEKNSRERIEKALNHKESDRIPLGFDAHCCGIHIKTYRKLRESLGLDPGKAKVFDRIQQLGGLDQDFKEQINNDAEGIYSNPPSGWEFKREDRDKYWEFTDEFGIRWRMPKEGGFYYDMWDHPLQKADSIKDIEALEFCDPQDSARFENVAEQFASAARLGKAPVFNPNTGGIFEMALWLRGFEEFYQDMILNPGMAEALLDKTLDYKKKFWEKALEVAGEEILVVAEADDIASQDSLLVSPDMYRKFIKPRHKELFSHIKKQAKSRAYIWYHSCGAVKRLLPDLIEEGVDIINPVQLSAADMNAEELKREFGKDLVFWGGGIDTQKALPNFSPEEVKEATKRNIENLAPGGGFVFAPVHNVQADVPAENFFAMLEGLEEMNK